MNAKEMLLNVSTFLHGKERGVSITDEVSALKSNSTNQKKLRPQLGCPASVISLGILCLLLCACDKAIPPTKVGSILAEPVKYQNQMVTVSGMVTQSFSILSVGYYKVEDSSGEIIVLPVGASPVSGTPVLVRGQIRAIYTIGDKSMLILEQKNKTNEIKSILKTPIDSFFNMINCTSWQ
jgi:hypothetical protein